MDEFVLRYQPDRWRNWIKGLDREPHPEDDSTRVPASLSPADKDFFRQRSSTSSESLPDLSASYCSSVPLLPERRTVTASTEASRNSPSHYSALLRAAQLCSSLSSSMTVPFEDAYEAATTNHRATPQSLTSSSTSPSEYGYCNIFF